jgi:hypothetical protein
MAHLRFERGDPERPVGHAFLVFRGSGATDEVAATYLIIPPITMDFAKYVPPLLASQLGATGLIAQTAFLPVPPAPEMISLAEVRRLAELRGDDVLDGGVTTTVDPASLMIQVADFGDSYAQAYQRGQERIVVARPHDEPRDALEGMAVLYSVLSERERVEELARRVGTLRYAIDGGDEALAETTRAEMRAIGAYLPERYRFEDLIAAASRRDPSATRLAQLFIERSYKMASNDPDGVASLDAEIALHAQGPLP